jgi:hypothetical protein
MPPTTTRNTRLSKRLPLCASVIGPFLIKLAKHLALLSCLMIAGTATGRVSLGSLGLFALIVAATLAHLFGRALERRAAAFFRLPKSGP